MCPGLPFRTTISGTTLTDVALVGDRLVAVGWAEGQAGRIVTLDPCTGETLGDANLAFAGSTDTRLVGVGDAGKILVGGSAPVGTDPRDGVVLTVDPNALTADWQLSLNGSSGADDLYDVVATPDLYVLAGATATDGTAVPWILQGTPGAAPCSTSWALPGDAEGQATAAAIGADEIVVAVVGGGATRLLRFPRSCGCPCTPLDADPPVVSLGLGEAEVAISRIVADDTRILAAGAARMDANSVDFQAVVASLAPQTGAAAAVWTDDPTTLADGFLSVDADGTRLVVGGAQGWNLVSNDFAGATGRVAAFALPLTNLSEPDWDLAPAGLAVAVAVASDPSRGAVFVAGNEGGSGFVLGCTQDGICPP